MPGSRTQVPSFHSCSSLPEFWFHLDRVPCHPRKEPCPPWTNISAFPHTCILETASLKLAIKELDFHSLVLNPSPTLITIQSTSWPFTIKYWPFNVYELFLKWAFNAREEITFAYPCTTIVILILILKMKSLFPTPCHNESGMLVLTASYNWHFTHVISLSSCANLNLGPPCSQWYEISMYLWIPPQGSLPNKSLLAFGVSHVLLPAHLS